MLINHSSDHLEIQIKMEPLQKHNQKEMIAQVSQIECTWEEVKGNGSLAI